MAIFYTDSGSFNNLEVTGSTILSGSLIVSGATNFGPTGLTGSLFGSASYAESSSYALTASYAANGGGTSTPAFPFSGSAVITGSLLVSGSGINVTASSFTLENQGGKLTIEKTAGGSVESSITTNGVFYVGTNDYFILGETPYVGAEDLTGLWANDIRSTINVYAGTVGIGVQSNQTNRLAISGSVSAASYTSSLNNQVGFLGTSSFSVSSSFARTAVTASYFSGSATFPDGLTVGQLTASNAQLTNIVDTTAANKILVLNTANNQIFTTASVGGGGSGTGFPFSGSAVITGSLLISSSITKPVIISGSNNNFFEIEVVNSNAGNNASADIVASNDATTDFGNYIDMGINSTTYNGSLVGGPSDGYLYFTSSVGELHVGNASTGGTSNVRLFAGGPSSDNTTRVFISSSGNVGIGKATPNATLDVLGNQLLSGSLIVSASQAVTASHVQLNNLTDTTSANKVLVLDTTTNKIFTTASVGGGGPGGNAFPYTGQAIITGSLIVSSSGINVIGNGMTGSVFSGSFVNILEMSMAVSGTIAANGTATVTLDMNKANYYIVSGSAAGTVTWVVNNPPPTGRVQTFVIEYTNGGIKTNNWFTNTRWPAGVAPSLTSASANPDLLSFTTDDNGSNWRGLLLQRGSA